jgi:Predicted membrane protein
LTLPPASLDAPRVSLSIALIALLFATSGILRLINPQPFVSIMPPWLPGTLALVLISGMCEIAGAAGILVPLTRVAAGWGLIILLLAVFPANVQMLLNARSAHASVTWMTLLIARLPLQVLLIIWVYRSTIRSAA